MKATKQPAHKPVDMYTVELLNGELVTRGFCPACNKDVGVYERSDRKGQFRCADYVKENAKPAYLTHRGNCCAKCGHVGEEDSELVVHHTHGTHDKSDAHEVVTLCQNCHNRIETVIRRYLQGVSGYEAKFIKLIEEGFIARTYLSTANLSK